MARQKKLTIRLTLGQAKALSFAAGNTLAGEVDWEDYGFPDNDTAYDDAQAASDTLTKAIYKAEQE